MTTDTRDKYDFSLLEAKITSEHFDERNKKNLVYTISYCIVMFCSVRSNFQKIQTLSCFLKHSSIMSECILVVWCGGGCINRLCGSLAYPG